jgi:signal transduction histidine kinase
MQPVLYPTHNTIHREISIIKHDIRNRLSALKLNLYVLERQGHPEQHDALIAMKEELGEINELLEDLNEVDNACE